MKFRVLAEYFERLESTTKRLEMIDLLAELFKQSSPGEIDKIVYLSQGRLLPPFRGGVIGLGDKLTLRAIAQATGQDVKDVRKIFKQLGDLGLAVENLSDHKGRNPTVVDTYCRLTEIAEASGAGSVERKISLLADLFAGVTPREARYIARFVRGRLRLGAGDATILEALSVGKLGDRSFKPELERAFNICSDIGQVAREFFEKGEEGIKEIKVKVGNPIRPALAERLPSPEDIIEKIGRCSVEAKYDGFRCQVHKLEDRVEIFSRRLDRTTEMFPEIIQGTVKQVKAAEAIIEGEALAYNEDTGEFYPFQVTIQRKRKYGIEETAKEYPLKLFCFDLLYIDGEDYSKRPYKERFDKLEKIITPNGSLAITDRIITDNPQEVKTYFESLIQDGLEGIIAKRLDSPYQAGARNFNWIKLKRSYRAKLTDTIDVVVVGYFRGRGKRAQFGIGAILGAVYDDKNDLFKTVTKIGSGLSEEQWMIIRKKLDELSTDKKPARVNSLIEPDVWVKPQIVLTVNADEVTRSPMHTCGMTDAEPGYALRFPRIVSWIREDKGPEDANTVQEVIDIFNMQKR